MKPKPLPAVREDRRQSLHREPPSPERGVDGVRDLGLVVLVVPPDERRVPNDGVLAPKPHEPAEDRALLRERTLVPGQPRPGLLQTGLERMKEKAHRLRDRRASRVEGEQRSRVRCGRRSELEARRREDREVHRPGRYSRTASREPFDRSGISRDVRISTWVAALASVFFALASAWELFGPLEAGHWSAMAAEGIAAENILRLHVAAPVTRYLAGTPTSLNYYCHHPYGLFVLQAVARAVFGHHPATVRLVAVGCSALTPPLVYKLAEELWDDVRVAAVATVAFVLLPIDLCFAGFAGLEVPTIFFGLLFTWATARLFRTWDRRLLLPVLLGAVGTTQSDWPGVVLVGAVAAFAAFGAFPRERLFRVWLALALGASVGCVLLYLAVFASQDQLAGVVHIFQFRKGTPIAPLSEIFGPRRRMWLLWMFTPAGLAILALALPLSLARVRRQPLEIIPLAWLLMASVQYFVFREGADVHIFWPHYFGVSVALGTGAFFSQALAMGGSRVVSGLAVTLPLLVFARVSLPLAHQARLTQGRFDEGGNFIDAEADASQLATWATSGVGPEATLSRTGAFPQERHVEYSAGRFFPNVSRWINVRSETATDRIVLTDARRTLPEDLRAYAQTYDVTAVGPFWRLDRAGRGKLEALRYVERQPTLLEQYFVSGTELVRTIGPDVDPWATWEWADHLGVAAPDPGTDAVTVDERRIAHNLAVARGDSAKASALRASVEERFAAGPRADFGDDVHLLGVSVDGGPVAVATLLWLAGNAYVPVDSAFSVKCKVLAPPALWPSAIDFYEKDMAPPMALRPALWKPGYLYAQRFVVRHRVGLESCEGSFSARELRASSDRDRVPLFTLP
jgi:hypothetical protein